jgi:adenylyltransferase/sulfurtransferase
LAKLLIIGAGGLGVPAALAAARMSCAHLTMVDPDRVELSNLARQIIYRVSDLGLPKAEVCATQLRRRYPTVEVEACPIAFEQRNGADLIRAHDFTIDGTDDPAVKFLINDLSLQIGRPFAYGGVLGMRGQTMTFMPGRGACLRCLFEEPPLEHEAASCRDAGIIGPVAGLIGQIQAAEAARCLRGESPRLAGRMVTYDANGSRMRSIEVQPRADCLCAKFSGAETIARAEAC